MPLVSVEVEEELDPLADLKEYIAEYNHEKHSGSPVLDQIMNASTIEEIEQYLKANFDYCDDCLLNMYRKYATKG